MELTIKGIAKVLQAIGSRKCLEKAKALAQKSSSVYSEPKGSTRLQNDDLVQPNHRLP